MLVKDEHNEDESRYPMYGTQAFIIVDGQISGIDQSERCQTVRHYR
jgi:hypothetical protein